MGAKIVLLSGDQLLAYKRDNKPDIPFPGMWDLPGGGREGDESPAECALREVEEEFALRIDPGRIVWVREYPARTAEAPSSFFLVARVEEGTFEAIHFGDEGERYEIMPAPAFLDHAGVVSHLKARFRDYLTAWACLGPEDTL